MSEKPKNVVQLNGTATDAEIIEETPKETPTETPKAEPVKIDEHFTDYHPDTDIFEEVPDDEPEQDIESEVDKSDFEAAEFVDMSKADLDNTEEIEHEEVTEESPKAARKSHAELSEKSKQTKAAIVRMITPSRIVKFFDMFVSKGLPMVLKRSTRDDWRLDEEDIELLAEILDVMIEEEGIEFWPAKVWLILALLVIYAMKGADVYTTRYMTISEAEQLEEEFARFEEEEQIAIKKMELQKRRLEILRQRQAIEDEIDEITTQSDNETQQKAAAYEEQKRKAEELAELKRKYPPSDYTWKGDELQYNLDGTPTKKRGRKSKEEAEEVETEEA